MASKTGLSWFSVVTCLIGLLQISGTSQLRAEAPSQNNLIYQIFVRSWADTPSDVNEIGDLKGICEKLDYLNDGNPSTDNDLEVGILWLMPVFPSTSYHGYDVTDYRQINPDYGTMQDFRDLIAKAHQRSIRIILDLPLNHTSDQHPWFREAVNNPESRFRKFYHFADINQPAPQGAWHVATGSNGKQVRYFGLFSHTMPDLDFTNSEVHNEVKEIAKFWLEQGVDGFRLDAAKHIFGDRFDQLPEPEILRNNDWWREFSDSVYRTSPQAVLIGEILDNKESLRRHAYGLDGLLDAPFLHAARSQIAFPKPNLLNDWKNFVNQCRDVNRNAHPGPGSLSRTEPFQSFLFLSSHDESPRLASHLEEMAKVGMGSTVDESYRVGMYLLTSLAKYPIFYYGDEIMQPGFKWNGNPPTAQQPGDGSGIYDETLREPLPWHKDGDDPTEGDVDSQTAWSNSIPKFDKPNDGISVEEQDKQGEMLDLVRGLTNLRTQHPHYSNGELGEILSDSEDWMVFEKVAEQDRYLVLINRTGNGYDYRFHENWFPKYINAQLIFWSDGKAREWKNETKSNNYIDEKVFVPPYGMVLVKQKLN